MGCDIHTMVEIQQYNYSDDKFIEGKWKAVRDQLFPYPYFRENEPISPYNKPRTSHPWVGRNYALFSVLADVRNTRMRSNIFDPTMEYEERDSIDPIAMPRGVPEDASKRWLKECERWGADFHSESWFTVQELVDARDAGAFSQDIIARGYVSLRDYLAHKNDGVEIESWSSYAGGGGVLSMHEAEWIALDPEEKDRLIKSSEGEDKWFARTYIRYEWKVNTGSWMKEFVETTIPLLVGMAPKQYSKTEKTPQGARASTPNLNAIRMVFAFDN